MKPAAFAYHLPRTLDEALELLAFHGEDARPLAGGQSLVPMMNLRIARPDHLVDLNALGELRFIRAADGAVEIGAMTRHCEAADSERLKTLCPVLPAVAATIGHYAILERGTVGGSLALADPSAQWPLLATLLDGRIDLAARGSRRSIPAADFFAGALTTAAAIGELVTGVAFPRLEPGEGWGYRAFTRRHGDFAIVAAAATVALNDKGAIARLRLAIAGAGDTPLRIASLEAAQRGRVPDAAVLAEIGRACADAAAPLDDAVASAQFRKELIEVLSARALGDAVGRARAAG